MAFLRTIPLWKGSLCGTSGTLLSDPIDLREFDLAWNFTLSTVVAGTDGTGSCGTTNFTYLASDTLAGSYGTTTSSGTIGTGFTTAGAANQWSFNPIVTPFMKIKVVNGTSAPAWVTATLNIR